MNFAIYLSNHVRAAVFSRSDICECVSDALIADSDMVCRCRFKLSFVGLKGNWDEASD